MPSESLGEATIRGLRWITAARVLSEAFAFVAAVALARLVTPAEFGHAAVALLFVTLSVMLTFEGFASALVQRASVEEADRRAAMLMSVVGGSVLTVAIYALRGPLWQPLFGSRTAALIQLASPTMLIASLGGVSRAIVWRNLDFRRTSVIDLVSLVVQSIASVALAATGLESKAIVIGGLAGTATTTVLLVRAAPPPLPRWSGRSQRQITAFGIPAALAALVDTLFRNIDYAILAARVSAAQTGFYYRAFNAGVVYQQKISKIMMQIAFPVYSRTRDREQLRRLHERATRLHAVVIFPLLASLIVLAPTLIPLVFGSRWKPAVEPTQILAVAGMLSAILTGYPQVMLAIGRPRALLQFNVAVLILYGTAILAASRHGIVVVSIVAASVYVAILIGVYRLLLQRHIGISIARLVPELGPAIVGCLALAAVTAPVTNLLSAASVPRVLNIALNGCLGLSVYAFVLRAGFRAAWGDLTSVVLRVFPMLQRLRRQPSATAPAVAP